MIARRTGECEVVVYAGDDPDQGRPVFRLNREEADALAEILGAPRIAERFADLTREVPGLGTGQVEPGAGSPFAGRPLGNRPDRPGSRSTTQTSRSPT